MDAAIHVYGKLTSSQFRDANRLRHGPQNFKSQYVRPTFSDFHRSEREIYEN